MVETVERTKEITSVCHMVTKAVSRRDRYILLYLRNYVELCLLLNMKDLYCFK